MENSSEYVGNRVPLLANRKLVSKVKGKCVWTKAYNDKVCNDSTFSVSHEIIYTETSPSKKKELFFTSGSGLLIFYFDLGKTYQDEATNIRD